MKLILGEGGMGKVLKGMVFCCLECYGVLFEWWGKCGSGMGITIWDVISLFANIWDIIYHEDHCVFCIECYEMVWDII